MAREAYKRLTDELGRTAVISDGFKAWVRLTVQSVEYEAYHRGVAATKKDHNHELEKMQETIDRLREELRLARPPAGATHRVKWIVGNRWFWVKDIDFHHGTFRNGFAADTWPCDEPHRDIWGRGLFNAEEAKTLVAL